MWTELIAVPSAMFFALKKIFATVPGDVVVQVLQFSSVHIAHQTF
jgi:hypothetical protein